MYSSFLSVPVYSQNSITKVQLDYPQDSISKSLHKIFSELNHSITKMIDTKKLNNAMTRLQLAKVNIMPAIEQIVKTTTIYSEYEFKQKLRNNEPMFCLQRSELLRAIEASRLLSDAKNVLKIDKTSFKNSDNSVASELLHCMQSKGAADKSIATSMKEVIVNRLTTNPHNPSESNKVYLDQNMIKRLMELHENIIGTMDSLQDEQLRKEVSPLLTDIKNLHDMSSGEQATQSKKKKVSRINLKFKNKNRKHKISNKKTRKKELIILPPECSVLNYETLEKNKSAVIHEEDTIKKLNPEPKKDVIRRNSSYDDFDVGKIKNSFNGSFNSKDKEEDENLPSDFNTTLAAEANNSCVSISSTSINETSGLKFPTEPLSKRKSSLMKQVVDINNDSISQAKNILSTCLDRLQLIRNYLNESADNSVLDQVEDDKKHLNAKDAVTDIPRGNVLQLDVCTDTVDLGLTENDKSNRREILKLLWNVLDQIDFINKLVTGTVGFGTRNKCPSKGHVGSNNISSPNLPFCDIINNEQKYGNPIGGKNWEHDIRNVENLTSMSKVREIDLNLVAMDVCPPREIHAKSVLQILCAKELYHPDSLVKAQLNNIGLENLIHSAAPSRCSKLVIVNDPRDIPDMPLKPSLSSLPLSQTDLSVIQNNVNRMKKMLDS